MSWWVWVALGIVLCVLELAIPAFFILWFGAAAIVTGLLLLLWPSLPLAGQLAFFGVLSIACVAAWFYFFRSRFRSETAITEESSAVGERGTVAVAAASPGDIGRARFVASVLGEEVWDIVSDEPLAVGNSVRVTAVLVSEAGADGRLRRILKVEKVH